MRTWATGYGALVPDPDKLLDLPEGFSYTVVSEAGKPLTGVDGVLPDAFDGTALFESGAGAPRAQQRAGASTSAYPAVAAPEFTYDPVAQGGTTTVELDADVQRRRRVRQPRRHAQQLRRRAHAVGHVADVRGDRGARRRRRL